MKRNRRRKTGALLSMVLILSAASLLGQASTPSTGDIVRSPGNAKWAANPQEARTRATTERKWIFYEFDRLGCGNCIRMEKLLYPAFEFEALLLPMVPVKVSLSSPEGEELARRYKIDDAPAILVTTPEGRFIFEMVGFTSAEDFYPHIHGDLDSYRKFARKIDAQDVPRLPAREALETGAALYQRNDSAAALPRLRRAVSAKDATPSIRNDARELLSAVQLDLGQIAASRETTQRLIETTSNGLQRQRAELFRAQLPLAENKPAEARALFQKFLTDHPDSPYRQQVSDMLDRLAGAATKR